VARDREATQEHETDDEPAAPVRADRANLRVTLGPVLGHGAVAILMGARRLQ
jgi:hypothetical protein